MEPQLIISEKPRATEISRSASTRPLGSSTSLTTTIESTF
jgi:hypothetical protein